MQIRNIIAVLVLSVAAYAQGGFYQDRVEGRLINGNALVAIPGATVTVCSDQACVSPVTVYSDAALTQSIGTSLTADANGNFSFYARPGQYFCQMAASGFSTAITPCQVSGANVLTAYNLDNILYVDGQHYAQTFAGLQQAINDCGNNSACTEVVTTDGTYDSAGACLTIPKNQMFIHASSFASATLRLNSDMDGFCPASLTQNLRIENFQILTNTGVTLTGNHAAIHLLNSPRPVLKNLLISTEATAGGCLLLENTGVVGNVPFGMWNGVIENVTCQRTSPNQGTPDSALGHFGIYCKGQATGTNPDCSMNSFNQVWVENHGVGMQFDFANSNTVTRAHLLLNSINFKCVSCKDNTIIARLNQFRNSGSSVSGTNEHYNFDSGSSDNILFGKLESPSTKGTDAGTRNNLLLGATDAWNIDSVVRFWPQSGGDPAGLAGSVFYRTDLSRLRVFDNALSVWQSIPQIAATGTATVDLASVASGACTADSADVTLTGASVGDEVRVTAATALPAGVRLIGRVTASNTGRFQLCNWSGGAVDRTSDTYTISVVK